jgi:hypothetical protein
VNHGEREKRYDERDQNCDAESFQREFQHEDLWRGDGLASELTRATTFLPSRR